MKLDKKVIRKFRLGFILGTAIVLLVTILILLLVIYILRIHLQTLRLMREQKRLLMNCQTQKVKEKQNE